MNIFFLISVILLCFNITNLNDNIPNIIIIIFISVLSYLERNKLFDFIEKNTNYKLKI